VGSMAKRINVVGFKKKASQVDWCKNRCIAHISAGVNPLVRASITLKDEGASHRMVPSGLSALFNSS